MKRTLFIVITCFIASGVLGQETTPPEVNTKFGKPSNEELKMTVYEPDTTAAAVVLCKKTNVFYDVINNDFRINYIYETKIKVLKSEGTSFADVVIPYYEDKKGSSMKEIVSQIDAFAYNIEEGKTVRTKMKREFIFKERLNDKYMQVKFSVPNVKPGTVIEYRYKILSDFYFHINNWSAQQSIPVYYTEYDITVPEYFKFNLDMHGTEQLQTEDETVGVNLVIGGQVFQCNGRHLCFKGNKLPGLHDDNYVWCVEDYGTQVNLELGGLDFPGALYKSFTQTWENIDEALLDDSEFGGQLKIQNPYREEMAALNLDNLKSNEEKIAAIYTLLKKNTWNEEYALYGGKSKKTVKEGIGKQCRNQLHPDEHAQGCRHSLFPIVMSRRSMGILPYAHPTIQKLNTFIVGIAKPQTVHLYYLDGSVNQWLPECTPSCANGKPGTGNNRGRQSRWVDLSQTCKNQLRSMVNAVISPDGKIYGSRNTKLYGTICLTFRKKYQTAKDSTEFVNELASKEDVKISVFNTQGIKSSLRKSKKLSYLKASYRQRQLHLLKPACVSAHEKNPFTQTERKLPVEYPYAEQITLSV